MRASSVASIMPWPRPPHPWATDMKRSIHDAAGCAPHACAHVHRARRLRVRLLLWAGHRNRSQSTNTAPHTNGTMATALATATPDWAPLHIMKRGLPDFSTLSLLSERCRSLQATKRYCKSTDAPFGTSWSRRRSRDRRDAGKLRPTTSDIHSLGPCRCHCRRRLV